MFKVQYKSIFANATAVIAATLAGCSQSAAPVDLNSAPSENDLSPISYMHRDRSNQFDRLNEAKSCNDMQLAVRWNHLAHRDPNENRPQWHQSIAKFGSGDDLVAVSANQTVFFSGTITQFAENKEVGGIWDFETADGNVLRGVMLKDFVNDVLTEDQRNPKHPYFIKPIMKGRALCGIATRMSDSVGGPHMFGINIAIDRDT